MKVTFTITLNAKGEYHIAYLGDDITDALKLYKKVPAGTVKVAVWRKGYLFRSRSVTPESLDITPPAPNVATPPAPAPTEAAPPEQEQEPPAKKKKPAAK